MAFTVLMHEKPMIRRRTGVVEALGAAHLHLPGGNGIEGLHIELSIGRGRTQRVIIPFDQMGEVETAIKMARAAIDQS
jgi:hypothetical protein